MGVISTHNNVQFVDSKHLLARIKRELKTFDQVGILDANDFYEYVMDVLNSLSIGGYIEADAVLNVKDGKAKLPDNYKMLYSVNLCKLTNSPRSHPRLQNGYVFYTDTLYEGLKKQYKCNMKCIEQSNGFKITVREYIEGIESIDNYNYNYLNKIHIVPSNSVPNHYKQSNYKTISIENGYLKANFDEGTIHIKYYALPVDEDGLPLVPDSEAIQKAIRYYAISQYFLNWYWNDEVPNGVAQKAAEAKRLYTEAYGQAVHESKLPSFATLVDYIKLQRNRFRTFQDLDCNY